MKANLKKRWKDYWEKKGWFSKVSDLFFVLLVVSLLIPASRKEISAFVSGITAMSPGTLDEDKQSILSSTALNWAVVDANGKSYSLTEYQAKPVFLNFWATWCPPCIAEMPDIQDLYDKYGDKVAFFLVTDESPQKVDAFMEKRGFDLPVFYHQSGVPQEFATQSIPTTFVISPEQKIVIRKTGAAKWNSSSMHQLLDEMMR
ncbi:MAG: redoxin domain-containing protein [Bacteroidales bacterium]|nr:redoxin domain-containing protein [Bacteroidales bacterium]